MIKKISLSIYIFMLLYNPPFFSIRGLWVLMAASWIGVIWNVRYILNNIRPFRLVGNYLMWIGIVLYLALIALAHGNGINYISGQIYWLVAIIPAGIVISAFVKKNGFGLKGLIGSILLAGTIQGLIATASFISPLIKNALISAMIKGHVFAEDAYSEFEIARRLYGFSAGLTFGMPVLQSFLAMLSVYMTVNHGKRYILYFPMLAFSAIINARTSVILFLICGILIVIQNNRNSLKKMIRILGFTFGVIIVVITLIPVLQVAAPSTYNWINTGVDELLTAASGNLDQGYFSYLLNPNKWIFPQGFDALFGTGVRVMGNDQYRSISDIGFVNDMWFGGAFYTLFIYCLFLYYCRRITRLDRIETGRNRGIGRYLHNSFLLSALFLNFKSYIIDIHCLSSLFILFLVFSDAYNEGNKENKLVL